MADISSIKKITKEAIKTKTSLPRRVSARAKPNTKPDRQWDIIKFILGTVIVALILGFLSMFVSYVQFVKYTYDEYINTINDYSDKRYEYTSIRLDKLESIVEDDLEKSGHNEPVTISGNIKK